MFALIALVFFAIVALIIFSAVVHILFSPWLLVLLAVGAVAWMRCHPRRSRRW